MAGKSVPIAVRMGYMNVHCCKALNMDCLERAVIVEVRKPVRRGESPLLKVLGGDFTHRYTFLILQLRNGGGRGSRHSCLLVKRDSITWLFDPAGSQWYTRSLLGLLALGIGHRVNIASCSPQDAQGLGGLCGALTLYFSWLCETRGVDKATRAMESNTLLSDMNARLEEWHPLVARTKEYRVVSAYIALKGIIPSLDAMLDVKDFPSFAAALDGEGIVLGLLHSDELLAD